MKGEEGGGVKEPAGAAAPPSARAPAPSDGDLAPPRALDRAPEVEALELWNETAGRAGLPLAQRLTDARRKALKFRLAESGGIEGWKIALSKIEASAFLTGKSRRSDDHANWRCDIDFMLRQAKFTKLMEGGFDDTPSTRKQSSADPRFEALAEFGRAGAG